ncbi:MAG: cbb3-type cytochrome c oxidase subunit II [Limisphaera sp.]
MNRGAWVFVVSLLGLTGSWCGLVWYPQVQLGQQKETTTVPDKLLYPVARPGLAAQGREVYRSEGCYTCHSQQVRQKAVSVGLAVTEAGTNLTELVEAILTVAPQWSRVRVAEAVTHLPFQVLEGVEVAEADRARRQIEVTGAKAVVTVRPVGPDLERGWGRRRSVAADFLWDDPVMPGMLRVGPDLANVGARVPDPRWLLTHLWDPQIQSPGSMMPPYRYLFEVRPAGERPSADALVLPAGHGPGPGWEVIPRPEAWALVAYLQSLNASPALFEAPVQLPTARRAGTETNTAVSAQP